MASLTDSSTYKIQIKLFGKILFLNEIMIHILEYSGNRMTREFMNKLNIKSNISIYNKCIEESMDVMYNGHNFDDRIFIVSKFYNALEKRIHDPDYMIKTFHNCKCCSRHQIHRPIHLAPYHEREQFDDWPNHSQSEHEQLQKECSCICRHASRWLCRKFNPHLDIAYYTL